MRFVPVKSTDQQDLQSLHRVRERLIVQRTALINHARGLLAEYGIVLPQGAWRFAAQAPAAIARGRPIGAGARALRRTSRPARTTSNRRVDKLDAPDRGDLPRRTKTAAGLAELPGVGPVIATALVASCRRWPPLPLGPRTCRLDRAGAAAIHNRRQASARRHRSTRQPLPADDR